MKTRPPLRPRRGITFLQVIFTICLLGFLAVPFARVYTVSGMLAAKGSWQATAVSLAEGELERARALLFSEAEKITSSSETVSMGGRSFSRRIAVSSLAEGLLRLDVVVSWTEGESQRSVSLAALRSEHD